ncbi:MAG TPA: ABC transporter permease [candidate division Zixibacteria bacterium]|nr:ABC transporter permease [candidate division Zixibacteria bacterium]
MRNLFPNAWHVARREYLQRTGTRTFVIVTIILALVGFGLAMLPVVIRLIEGDDVTRVAVDAREAELDQDPVTALRLVLDAGEGSAIEVVAADDPEEARRQVRRDELDGLLTLRRENGDLAFEYFGDAGLTDRSLIAVRTAATQLAIADRLQRAGVDPQQAGEIFAPTAFQVEPVDPDATDPDELYGQNYVIAMAMVILTFTAIVTYGTWVATSVAEEKSSRVMELLITAATPRQLLAGKVLGNGFGGLTQFGAVLVAALLGFLAQGTVAERVLGDDALSLTGIDLWILIPFGLLFIPGFLLYCTLYAGLGSMASRQEDVNQVTGPMLFIGMAGYFAAFIGINTPDASWVQVLSWIPFFSPYLLPARTVLTGNVALWEWVLAGVLMLILLAVAIWVAARIYSAGVLLYGQRGSLRQVWRAVRVDR